MIWHIFRKDLRLSWKLALVAAALRWIEIALMVKLGLVRADHAVEELMYMVRIGAALAACLVVVAVVHNDSVPGATEDWLMRPIRRRDMLLAKILFVLIAVEIPSLVGCVGKGLAFGLGFRESLLGALWQGAMMSLGLFAPLLAVAAMTATILEIIVTVVACICIAVGLGQLASFFGWSLDNGPGALRWIDDASLNAGLFLAAVVALGIQYRWRDTNRARFAFGAVFAIGAASALLPWQAAFALQQRVAPVPGAARDVRLIFDPSLGRNGGAFVYADGSVSRPAPVFLPIRAEGLAPGNTLVADRVEVHMTGTDGSIQILTPVPPSFASDQAWQSLESFKDVRPIPRNKPVRVTVEYWLTLVKETDVYPVPEPGGSIRILSLGRCSTTSMPFGPMATLACVKAGPSAGCSVETMDRFSGQRATACSSYAPSFVWLPDWDEITVTQTQTRFLPSAAGLLHVKTYEVLDHFIRHVEIPNVRLADWEVAVHH